MKLITKLIVKGLPALRRPRLWPCIPLRVLPTFEHTGAFAKFSFDAVIDVGANKGQFAAFAANQWAKAEIICFEPIPGPRQILSRVLKAVSPGRHTVHDCALGSEVTELEMHIASRVDSSSLLPLGQRQKSHFNMEEVETIKVPVRTLDDMFCDVDLSGALLKVDVQGFEYEVLLGGKAVLPQFKALYVEMSFVELYEGQRLASEVIALAEQAGFVETGRFNEEIINGELIQADILFEKRGS